MTWRTRMVHRQENSLERVKLETQTTIDLKMFWYTFLSILGVLSLLFILSMTGTGATIEQPIVEQPKVNDPTSGFCSSEYLAINEAYSSYGKANRNVDVYNAKEAYTNCLGEHGLPIPYETDVVRQSCEWIIETGRVNPDGDRCSKFEGGNDARW